MFSATVWKKYLVRVIKIVTMVFLCHQVLNAKLLGSSSKGLTLFYIINNIICISAGKKLNKIGVFNTYLLHSSLSEESQRNWLYFNYLKVTTAAIIFTPLFSLLSFSKSAKVDIQFYWIVCALIISPMARYYREFSVMKKNQKKEK
jgi:hypothetical protein